MPEIKITRQMMENLDYDKTNNKNLPTSPKTNEGSRISQPTAMFIFHKSDLDAAAFNLEKSMQNPFSPSAIKTIFVQESCSDDFIAKYLQILKPHSSNIAKNSQFIEAMRTIAELKAKILAPPDADLNVYPLIVRDFTQEHFGNQKSGITTMHTFRTTKEAAALAEKDMPSINASIWSENHAVAYTLVSMLKANNFFINCNNIPLSPIQRYIDDKKAVALIENSYHYESMISSNGEKKNIVFPFGTIFAN